MTGYDINAQNDNKQHRIEIPIKIYKTTNDTLLIDQITESDHLFLPSSSFSEKTKPTDTYWIKIDFIEELDALKKDSLWYLNLNKYNFSYASIFYVANNSIVEKLFGSFNDPKTTKSILHPSGIAFKTNSLIKNRFLYLKVKRVKYFESVSSWKVYYVSKETQNLNSQFYSWEDIKTLIPKYLFTGICLIMFILTFAFYITSKKIEFLFYSLYVIWLFVYLNGDVLRTNNLLFGGDTIVSYWLFQIAQVFINLFYVLFVMYYLDTKREYPKLWYIINVIISILSVIIILDTLFFYIEYFTGHLFIMNVQRLVMTLFGVGGMFYLLFYAKDRLPYFIVTGSFLYMIGAWFLFFFGNTTYMIMGSALEITVFALGLSYKIQQEHIEKIHYQKESFINNNKALRAQINPHFIFNSLNSIQNLILSNDKESAVKYLNKFSLLMRNLLESSIETSVILSEEIKLLKKYLELESLRFDNTFNYTIELEENLNPDAIEIPMLIVQPFIENAILHGLLNKNGTDKNLAIRFKTKQNTIICEVEDNGVGRSNSSEINSILKKTNKSRGVEVTKKRLQLLDPSKNENNIEFIDKTDHTGQPLGTKVIIKIPTEYSF
ncbi:hypothetical protein GCM10022259_41690 [Aquimarina mytili]